MSEVEYKNIKKNFGSVEVLKDINLNIGNQKFVVLLLRFEFIETRLVMWQIDRLGVLETQSRSMAKQVGVLQHNWMTNWGGEKIPVGRQETSDVTCRFRFPIQ